MTELKKSGNYIFIKHNDQFVTKYLHLEEFSVAKNDLVKEGDMIGKVGKTGMSILPHLHYEIRVNGEKLDPLTFETTKAESLSGAALSMFETRRERTSAALGKAQ